MSKRSAKRGSQDREQFEAYGEYTYDYLHSQGAQNGETQPQAQPPAQPTVEMVKRAHKRRRVHGFYKGLIVLAALCIALIVAQETVFRLRTVYVVGNETKTPQQVVVASGLVSGRNMFSITEEEVAAAFAQDHTIIFSGMQKEFPGTVYLYIQERKVAAAMQWLGVLYTLDEQGVVMAENSTSVLPEGMPVITGFRVSNLHVGQQLMVRSPKQLEAYCAIIKELSLQLYADQVSEVNLADPENLYLVTTEGVTVRLGNAQDMRAKIGAVRTDMAYLRQLGTKAGILDVTTPEDAKYMPEN